MVLLDGPAVAHMVRPSKSGTFKEYVPHHIVPFLRKMLSTSVQRIDVLWDTYPEGNMKAQTQAWQWSTHPVGSGWLVTHSKA